MNITGLDILTHLHSRWETITGKAQELGIDAETVAQMRRIVALFRTIEQHSLPNGTAEAEELGRTLRGNRVALSVALEAMFQIRKLARPFMVREYPGVEGVLEGQLQFEELCNTLLKYISKGYTQN